MPAQNYERERAYVSAALEATRALGQPAAGVGESARKISYAGYGKGEGGAGGGQAARAGVGSAAALDMGAVDVSRDDFMGVDLTARGQCSTLSCSCCTSDSLYLLLDSGIH